VRGQPFGHGGPDALGSAGKDRDFACQLEVEIHEIYVSIGT
jgi:hypothetical protein